jgi:hypothetical protein
VASRRRIYQLKFVPFVTVPLVGVKSGNVIGSRSSIAVINAEVKASAIQKLNAKRIAKRFFFV